MVQSFNESVDEVMRQRESEPFGGLRAVHGGQVPRPGMGAGSVGRAAGETPKAVSLFSRVEGAMGLGQCSLAPASRNSAGTSPNERALSTMTTNLAYFTSARRRLSTSRPVNFGKTRSSNMT